MGISKVLVLIAIQIITLNFSNGDDTCDDISAVVAGCDCIKAEKPNGYMLVCRGNDKTDSALDGINQLNGTFYALIIQNTNLTKINENCFIRSTFENIFIENNALLKSIANNAFDKYSAKRLIIRNNPSLDGKSLFDLAKTLSPKERIEFEGNGLTSVPDNAFGSNSTLKYIYLQNNNITSVGVKAFIDLPNLTQIGLNNNKLKDIEGLELSNSLDGKERKISIFLHNNSLTDLSFKESFKSQDNIIIKLFLEDNNFYKIPLVLKNFLKNGKNELYFHNNNFKCYKEMEWVKKYSNQIFNVWCSNLDDIINRVELE